MAKGKILAIDDTPASLKLLTEILEGDGYEVRSAINGELALYAATASPPDFILLDVRMPGMDGFEVCRQLKSRAETREIPIIFVSALSESDDKVLGFELGAVDFVTKPYQREELLARVRTHLENVRLRTRFEALLSEQTIRLEREISARRQDQILLSESESRFQTLANAAPVLIWVAGTDKLCNWFNQVWLDFTGRSMEQEMGNGWAEGVHPDDFDRCLGIYVNHFDRREEFRMEYRLQRYDGEYRWIDDHGVPRFDSQGSFVGYIGSCIDITDNINTIEKLKESENRLRTIIECEPECIKIISASGIVLDMNPAGLAMLEAERPEQVIGHPGLNFIAPKYRHAYAKMHKHVIEGEPQTMLYKIIGLKGGVRWIETHAVPMRQANGTVVHLAVARDISERIESERQLRQLSEQNRAMFMNSPDAYLIMELDGGVVADCNQAAERMLKGSREKIVGKTPDMLSPPLQPGGRTSLESVPEKIEKALKTGYNRFEWVHRRFDGEDFWAEIAISVIDYQNRKVLLVAWRDISERKLLELTLKEQQSALRHANQKLQLLNSMVEDSADPFYALDVSDNFRMVFANKASCQHYGLLKERLLSMRVPDWDPDVGLEKLQELLSVARKKGHQIITTRHRVASGQIIPVEVSVNHLQDESGEYLYGYIIDIRERNAMEQAMRQAKDAAEKSARAKSEFLANMSHEIRTPMNGIIGLSQLALNREMSPAVRDYLKKINHASHSLLGILNDILDFSKLEAGKVTLEHTTLDLDALLDSLRNLFEEPAHAKQLDFSIFVAEGTPRALLGDPLRLQQILSNLLSNAIKFTEKGKVNLLVDSKLADRNRVGMHFAVQDTGIGIAEEVQSNLYQAFYQADGSTTRKFGGTGLGLAISRQLLHLMGGYFTISSSPGQGTTFSFDIVLEKREENQSWEKRRGDEEYAGKLEKQLQNSAQSFKGAKVLVVEDNNINQIVVSEFLKLSGMDVAVAGNGLVALDVLEKQGFDVVLMDLHMPVMDGFEATKCIRANPRLAHLPIIALTADVVEDERKHCLSIGMNDFATKPIDPQALIIALKKWVGNKLGS